MKPPPKKESEYDIQAREFAEKIGLTMEETYIGHFARLGENTTANYEISLKRGTREYRFQFSTSINDSWRWTEGYQGRVGFKSGKGMPPNIKMECWKECRTNGQTFGRWQMTQTKTPPTLYDILACLTKYDPGSFEDFCGDFGYDNDSISAEKTYRAVMEEWRNVDSLFHDVLEELQEIN